MIKELVAYRVAEPLSTVKISVYDTRIPAGFPSPALDHREERIDLTKLLIRDPESTFIVDAEGESMTGALIIDKSKLVVDRSIKATNGRIVVAILNDGFTVKFYQKINGVVWLVPANKDFNPTQIQEFDDFEVWGVVIHIITNASNICQICTLL